MTHYVAINAKLLAFLPPAPFKVLLVQGNGYRGMILTWSYLGGSLVFPDDLKYP